MHTGRQLNELVLEPTLAEIDNDLKVTRPLLPSILLNSSLSSQRKSVINVFLKWYKKQKPKDLQVKTIVSLINGFNTFLLAGTGYGKSRIPEMFLRLFDPGQLPVVLVLNPLDALGDNQVSIIWLMMNARFVMNLINFICRLQTSSSRILQLSI